MSTKIVQFNEEVMKEQIRELVRGSVEETLTELLKKEAEQLRRLCVTSTVRHSRVIAAATMTVTSLQLPAT